MDSNNISFDLASIMVGVQNLSKKLRTGEGLGLSEEKQKEFQAEAEKKGLNEKLDELDNALKEFKDKAKDLSKNG